MTRSEKSQVIEDLKVKFSESQYFYFADASTLTVEQVNKLRRTCFEKGIEVQVVKNTLAQKAMEASGEMAENFEGLYSALAGPTTVFFADTGNAPAKVIKEFRKSFERPILKAAYIDSDIFLGDHLRKMLSLLLRVVVVQLQEFLRLLKKEDKKPRIEKAASTWTQFN